MIAAATEPPWAVTPEKLGEAVRRLVEAAHPRRIILFGSRARGDAHGDSDVDLLITTRPGCSLFDLGGLLADLEDLLHCRVDLVTDDGLKPRLRERVLREAIPL